MYRHHNGQWDLIETTMTGQAGRFYQYSTPTPGFSNFLKQGQVADSGAGETVATSDSGMVFDPTPAPEANTTKGTPGFGILLGILAIKVVLVYRKRNKN